MENKENEYGKENKGARETEPRRRKKSYHQYEPKSNGSTLNNGKDDYI